MPRPERGAGRGTVLYAPWRGFRERPWFGALLYPFGDWAWLVAPLWLPPSLPLRRRSP